MVSVKLTAGGGESDKKFLDFFSKINMLEKWRPDARYNDTQSNDIQHSIENGSAMCRYLASILVVFMQSVTMLQAWARSVNEDN